MSLSLLSSVHQNLKKALSIYNLDDYQIIIFSDNIESAKNKVSPLNLNFVE